MRRLLLALFLLTVGAMPALAKGPTVRITINGADLAVPIDVADPVALRPFNVWSGPEVTVNGVAQTKGFIIEWSSGSVPEPAASFPRYQVTFHAREGTGAEPVYVVSYAYDPVGEQGYVYLPGRGDPHYQLNTRAIYRRLEGHWYQATPEWDEFIVPFLARR